MAWVPLTNWSRTAARLSAENACEHPVDHLSALIAVSVTTHGSEMLSANPLRLKRSENLLKPIGHSSGPPTSKGLLTLSNSFNLLTGKCSGLTEIHGR